MTSRTWGSSSTTRTSRAATSASSRRRDATRHGNPSGNAHDLVAPSPLGCVEGGVGGPDQLVAAGRLVFGERGDPEAARDRLAVFEGMTGDELTHAVGVEQGAGLRGLHQQDHELVAAPAGDHVDPARVLQQQLGHVAERRIADRMTELVVDPLEAVEIEEHDGYRMT